MLGTPATVDQIAEHATRLYTLPAVAAQVLQLTSQPEVDTRTLKECIENDPALTTRVLRVVNSSMFGLSREVGDLSQALALLGIKPLKLLVLGFSLPPSLLTNIASETLARYWKHTLTKAVAAREISDRLWHVSGEEAFIAALLQDVGILALIQQIGEPYTRFLDVVHTEGADLCQTEREKFGFDHTKLTAVLLTAWNLPESLTQAVRYGGSLECIERLPSADRNLPRVLYVAELLANTVENARPAALAELLRLCKVWPELKGADWDLLATEIEVHVSQLADLLALEIPNASDYRDMLSRAHAQLSTAALDALGDLVQQRNATPANENAARFSAEAALAAEAVSLAGRSPDFTRRVGSPAPRSPEKPTAARGVAVEQQSSAEAPEVRIWGDRVGSDASLLARLRVAVSACRQNRCAVSLLLIELDRYQNLVFKAGPAVAAKLMQRLGLLCDGVDLPGLTCQRTRESRYALVLPDCDRSVGVEIGNQLRRQLQWSTNDENELAAGPLTVSIGIAAVQLPPKNLPAEEIVESADRCLRGVVSSGGDGLKSIELY